MKPNEIEISHSDKVLFPDAGITKGDLADYYQRISTRLLPFAAERPLTLRAFPEGIDEEGFFNKHAPEHFPDFITRIEVPTRESGRRAALMSSADKAADLVYFAGQNVIEIHAALSTRTDLERPDQLIVDFDPSNDDFEKVRKVALGFCELLDSMGLNAFWKTTGSRGLHAHLPIRPERDFATVKEWAKAIARKLHDKMPQETTLELRKDKRDNKVFIDVLRNEYGQTAVLPYSVRARKGAPVATPIRADELGGGDLLPDRYTMKNVFQRLGQIEDPWRHFKRHRIAAHRLAEAVG
ncbi:MAG: non-homologous end-joining DNA ligase [Pseudomonadota bacterium]